MIRFNNDYNRTAHPRVWEVLQQAAQESHPGYGTDDWCARGGGHHPGADRAAGGGRLVLPRRDAGEFHRDLGGALAGRERHLRRNRSHPVP